MHFVPLGSNAKSASVWPQDATVTPFPRFLHFTLIILRILLDIIPKPFPLFSGPRLTLSTWVQMQCELPVPPAWLPVRRECFGPGRPVPAWGEVQELPVHQPGLRLRPHRRQPQLLLREGRAMQELQVPERGVRLRREQFESRRVLSIWREMQEL